MTKKIFLFIIFIFEVFSEEIYDTKFLLSSLKSINIDYWRHNDISLIHLKEENFALFYNFSSSIYQNNDPSNFSLSNFKAPNISNQDALLYFIYDDSIQIYSYEVNIDPNKIQIKLTENVMNILNQHYVTLSNISDLIIFQLSSEQIKLFSKSHTIESDTYYVFPDHFSDFTEIIEKIKAGILRIFIYFPLYVENTLNVLNLNLETLKLQIETQGSYSIDKNLLAYTNNYSLYVYKENNTISLLNNHDSQILNFYNFEKKELFLQDEMKASFIEDLNIEQNYINMQLIIANRFYFYSASFEKGFFHYLGSINVGEQFTVDQIVDSPSSNILTVILLSSNFPNNFFFLRFSKSIIFSRKEEFKCDICFYYNFYNCVNPDADCSIILQTQKEEESDPYFKVWLSVLVSVFGCLLLIILFCFIVQRFCIGIKKMNLKPQISNYDEVEERLKTLDKKKLESLMKKYSITVQETNMENSDKLKQYMDIKCTICMELLPSQPITYFSCKKHIVHTKCLILYEEETTNHTYKCPFRCL